MDGVCIVSAYVGAFILDLRRILETRMLALNSFIKEVS